MMAEEKAKADMEAEQKRLEAAIGSAVHLKLDEQNKSGQKGEVTITQIGTSTVKVIVSITGKPSKVPQPAHIHLGACPTPGAVKYPLTNIEKGASQTELQGVTLEKLLSELPLAVNVHKSEADAKVYTSCGNIENKKEEVSKGEEKKADAMKADSETKKETGKPTAAEEKKEVKVNYTEGGFAPKTVTIKKGEAVVFENKTGKRASVASDEHPTHLIYPEFDQYKTDQRGKDEFRFTFEKTGTWNYHDHLNANVTGTVIVE
jgi:plastocyanin